MTLITEEYRELNKHLHQTNAAYGVSGQKWMEKVWGLAHRYKIDSVLDYGSGKETLHQALKENVERLRMASGYCCLGHAWIDDWQNYDPAIPGREITPLSADLVTCTDVMEHIEPSSLKTVLDDLRRLSRKVVFLTVATRPAMKHLADGRNAHLIVREPDWWLPKLWSRWRMMEYGDNGGEFWFVGVPK